MAKRIKLTKGKYAIVDDEDYDELIKHKWSAHQHRNTWYARTSLYQKGKNPKTLRMHRVIMNAKDGELVDHKDRNGLNNKKSNLRICTSSNNQANRIPTGTSKYKGIYLRKWKVRLKTGKIKIYSYWRVTLMINGKEAITKSFATDKEAALAYNEVAIKKYGEFAYLNIIK